MCIGEGMLKLDYEAILKIWMLLCDSQDAYTGWGTALARLTGKQGLDIARRLVLSIVCLVLFFVVFMLICLLYLYFVGLKGYGILIFCSALIWLVLDFWLFHKSLWYRVLAWAHIPSIQRTSSFALLIRRLEETVAEREGSNLSRQDLIELDIEFRGLFKDALIEAKCYSEPRVKGN